MQINKSEIMKFIRNIEKKDVRHDSPKTAISSDHSSSKQSHETRSTQVDSVRSHVLNLQSEVKNIQTEISSKQIQVAFLDEIPNSNNWKENLEKFLSQNFSNPLPVINEAEKGQYMQSLNSEIQTLNNSMLMREVKLENIISSGIIDLEKSSVSDIIMKDSNEVRNVFSKIRKDSIAHLFIDK